MSHYSIHHQYPISKLTTIKSSGHIHTVIQCPTVAAIQNAFQDYPDAILLGNGSNSVISPTLSRPVVRLTDTRPYFISDTCVYLPAGITTAQILKFSIAHTVSGLEFTAGVPASMGGMIRMNFGCWGQDIATRLDKVCLWSTASGLYWVPVSDLSFGYRQSGIRDIIIGSTVILTPQSKAQTVAIIRDYVAQRNNHQPSRERTYGCMFMNPSTTPLSAGALIEQAGLKGYRIGDASVSTKHANFMINHEAASVQDITRLLTHIQTTVYAQFKIMLTPEVCVFD